MQTFPDVESAPNVQSSRMTLLKIVGIRCYWLLNFDQGLNLWWKSGGLYNAIYQYVTLLFT